MRTPRTERIVMRHAFSTYRVQIWRGDTKLTELEHLSIDAAREVARIAPTMGQTGRIMCHDADYCEVYALDGVRVGTWAETTCVWGG